MQKPEAVVALNRLGVEVYAALEYGCRAEVGNPRRMFCWFLGRETWKK